jgi:hypothetical protein
MTYFRRIFATAIIFLSTSVWCDSGSQRDRFGRSNLVVPVGENEPLLARRYEAASALRGSPASNRRGLGGNSLFGSWIGTRELTCPEAGMFVCAGM